MLSIPLTRLFFVPQSPHMSTNYLTNLRNLTAAQLEELADSLPGEADRLREFARYLEQIAMLVDSEANGI